MLTGRESSGERSSVRLIRQYDHCTTANYISHVFELNNYDILVYFILTQVIVHSLP
jgi:hypothetical protein